MHTIRYVSLVVVLFTLVACNTNDDNQDQAVQEHSNRNYINQPISYDTKEEAEDRFGYNTNITTPDRERDLDGFQDHLERPGGQDGAYTRSFYNQDSEAIARVLNDLDAVELTQAVVTDERVIVAVKVNQEYDENSDDITRAIRNHIEEMYPNKEVELFTTNIYWNKMRDLNSRLKYEDDPDNTKRHIDYFLGND